MIPLALCAVALGATPASLADAALEAMEQLRTCEEEGCEAASGARAAFVAAVYTYQEEGVADGALAAAVRSLDPALFGDLPDVLRDAATQPPPWAMSPAGASLDLPHEGDALGCIVPVTDAPRDARVVVLQWQGTDTTYETKRLQGRIRASLDATDVTFYPDADLYQLGRATDWPALDQQGAVAVDAVQRMEAAAEQTASIPEAALAPADWEIRAHELHELSESIFFVDRSELREPLFHLFAQLGRAAEFAGLDEPPFVESVDGQRVNFHWYLAASLAHRDPALLSTLSDPDVATPIGQLKDQLEGEDATPLRISFAMEDRVFDPMAFAEEYRLTIDAVEWVVTDPDGIVELPAGRADISLTRDDGYGLSERVRSLKPSGIYFVRNHARSKLVRSLQKQLLRDPDVPTLEYDMRRHLSVYQCLHPASEVYVAMPVRGSTARKKLNLWRWDHDRSQLVR